MGMACWGQRIQSYTKKKECILNIGSRGMLAGRPCRVAGGQALDLI